MAEFADVISEGDRRRSLEALRDKLARAMDEASSGVVPQVAAQLRATLKEIAELPDGKKVTTADELRDRRKARLAAANPPAPAVGEGRK